MAAQRGRRLPVVLLAGLVAAMAGCGTANRGDKTGQETVVLTLGTIDSLDPDGQMPAPAEFIRKLGELSGGTIKVQVHGDFEEGAPEADADLVKAIGAGTMDLGIPATRGFAGAGLPGLSALDAPLVLTSYDAEKAVVSSELAGQLLGTLKDSPVVGLALTPGSLRRPFSTDPLRSPGDWKGISFRSYGSDVQDDTISALGATPKRAGWAFPDLVAAGELDGAELDIAQYAKNAHTMFTAATRNVVLWPKMTVLTMNRARFDGLSDEQRGWITAAAAAAVQKSLDFTIDESDAVARTCQLGTFYYDASDADIAALRTAVAPVIASIAADPVAGPLLPEVQKIAAEHPTSVPDVPAACLKH